MKLRVMIVEDDASTRQLILEYISLIENCETVAVGEAMTAMAALGSFKPDLIITDHNMPGITGLELIKRIKSLTPHVSIVMMTASSKIETVIDAMRSGAEDYIAKPFDLSQIDRIIARAYERKNCIKSLDQIEAEYIDAVILQCGSVAVAAERLGINPSTIWRKRKKAA